MNLLFGGIGIGFVLATFIYLFTIFYPIDEAIQKARKKKAIARYWGKTIFKARGK